MLNWTWNVRTPTESNPLLIDVGTGSFELKQTYPGGESPLLYCRNNGNVTLRGSGRDNTIIAGGGGNYGLAFNAGTKYLAVIGVIDCNNLSFQDLTIKSTGIGLGGSSVHHGVVWKGGGTSVWTNISVEANMYGWVDACTSTNEVGKHFWFSSRILSTGGYYNIAYASTCGVNSFYGGEIIVTKATGINTSGTLVGVATKSVNGNVDIYGSLVRAVNPVDSNVAYGGYISNSLIAHGHGGMFALDQSSIHMHGGIISVKSEIPGKSSVFGIAVQNGGSIHTPDTAFGLKPSGSGSATRITNISGTASSPFQWPAGTTPPAINSQLGSDTFVETDCDSAGDCSGNSANPQHPHIMIYDATCNAGLDPWFDAVTNACRQ